MSVRRFLIAAAIVFTVAGPAYADDLPPLKPGGIAADIVGTQQLPGSSVTAVESASMENLSFIVGNGRFVIVGRVFDTWGMKELKSLAEIRDLGDRLDLSALKLDWNELGPLRIGHGPKIVRVFVDPRCPYCHQLMQQMDGLAETYTFELLVVPVLGAQSQTLTRELSCAASPDKAVASLVAGTYKDQLNQAEPCDLKPIQKRLVTAQLLGVTGVPMTIAPDGRVLRGFRPDFGPWLANRS